MNLIISTSRFWNPDRKLDALTALAEELYRTSDTRKNLPNFRGIFVVTEFSDSVMKSII